MKVAIIHGQGHKGVTYTMTKEVVDNIKPDESFEFFLPKDGPDFCVGCFQCFLKGNEYCPSAEKMKPIIEAILKSDIIIFDTPNYVLEMDGAMKNLFDHLAFMWVTHRPQKEMFNKVGIVISSSAGAPATHTVKSMAKQLKWLEVPKVYKFAFICNAFGVDDIAPKKLAKMKNKARKIAEGAKKSAKNQKPSLRTKMFFNIFRNMQKSPSAAWNPTDRDWWDNQGWTKKERPWK